MQKKKALRRRCDLPACGKLYRHADPRSRTCSIMSVTPGKKNDTSLTPAS